MNWGQFPDTPVGVKVIGPSTPAGLTTLTPRVEATVSSSESVPVGGSFDILSNNGDLLWSGSTARGSSGSTVGADVPVSVLQPGQTYTLRVWASDRWGARSVTPAVSTFRTAAPAPPPTDPTPTPTPTTPQDPVVQQILALSPGATEADVIAQINSVIAGSSEDGGSPYTFDQAKEIVLYFQRQVAEGQSQEEVATAATSQSCTYGVQVQGSALQVVQNGVVNTLRMVDGSDPAQKTFSGTVGGSAATGTVWLGASDESIETSLTDSAARNKALTRASLDGAVSGDGPTEVTKQISTPEAPSNLVPVIYKLAVDDRIEAGIPSTREPEALTQEAPSARCAKWTTANDQGAEVKTATGTFVVPSSSQANTSPAADGYPASVGAVRYRTFIPDATASTSVLCGTFAGDDRDFSSYFKERNRTRASIFYKWDSADIDVTVNIGTTHRLETTESFAGGAITRHFSEKYATASADGIQFVTPVMSPTYGSIRVNHSVGNPLCAAGGSITYNAVFQMWKDGTAKITGTAGKVPSHEAYVYPKSEAYGKVLYQRKRSGFGCLSLPCGSVTLRKRVG